MARVTWFDSVERGFTFSGPIRAHQIASQQAAGISAQMIRSKQTGALARDVSRAKPIGPLHSIVGSSLPYAVIEHFGGTIEAKRLDARGRRLLYIRGKRTARSDFRGAITATKPAVVHKGKRYLNGALESYPRLFIFALRQQLPQQGRLF